ncbi:MAG TPA: TetR/AcrR family transcriptional regulator [Acidobacteriota bacterium]|nr:TetR/AcrR family transcriptional regulator [Acidobacteriota bacterium]
MKKTETIQKRGEKTRQKIISEAASLFHHQGYTATGLDQILKKAEVTKGAFYHHFRSKKDVALAVIREVVADQVQTRMIDPVINASNPLVAIRNVVLSLRKETPDSDLLTGCPINNLANELALQDPEIQMALATLFHNWEAAWTKSLQRELKSGRRHNYKDPRELSLSLIALIEGAQAMAKAHQSRKPLDVALKRVEKIISEA